MLTYYSGEARSTTARQCQGLRIVYFQKSICTYVGARYNYLRVSKVL